MIKIGEFNKLTLRMLRGDIDAALASIGTKYDIDLKAGNARFTADSATFKLECSLLNADGKAETKELTALKAYYPDLVNKQVSIGRGITGTIIGFNSRAQKYPFLLKAPKGVYKISSTQAGLSSLN